MPVVNLVLTLGQHVAYVAEIFARQPRTFLFTVALSGSRARLLRWDRAGGVATEAFDLREQPGLLCEFLWRFAQLSDAGRGHDPSVAAAAPEDEARFRAAIEHHLRSLEMTIKRVRKNESDREKRLAKSMGESKYVYPTSRRLANIV